MDILDWNGIDLPESLRHLPPGRYILQAVDEVEPLTPEQEEGLVQALHSAQQGRGLSHDEVRKRLERRLKQ